MKIKKIYMENFGKFNKFELDFKDNINIIFGDNEKGKTTILAFIYMMFYGSNSQKRDISNNLRKKYMTWGKEQVKGYIIFEYKKIEYRLDRIFGKQKKDDFMKLSYNKNFEDIQFEGQPGEFLFNISEDLFYRLVYLSSEHQIFSDELSKIDIHQRFLNLVNSMDENISYSESIEKIENKIQEISKKNKGELFIKNNELESQFLVYEESLKNENEKIKLQKEIKVLELEKESILIKLEKNKILDKKIHEKKLVEEKLNSKQKELILIKENANLELKIKKRYRFRSLILSIVFIFLASLAVSVLFNNFLFLGGGFLIVLVIYIFSGLFKENYQIENYSIDDIVKNISNLEKDFIERNNQINLEKSKRGNFDEEILIQKLENINNAINVKNAEFISVQSKYKEPSILKNNINSIRKQIENLEYRLKVLNFTKEEIKNAYSEMERDFTPVLNEKMNSLVSFITENKYKKLVVSRDFEVFFENENKDIISYKYLSSGTIEQLYFCLKIILNNMIFEGDSLFLLDDIFIKYDKKRFDKVFDLLFDKKIDYSQILYFTCNDRFENHKNINLIQL